MGSLGSAIGAIIGSAISNGYTKDDFVSSARDLYDSLNESRNNLNGSSGGYSGGGSGASVSNGSSGSAIENQKKNVQNLLNQYGRSEAGLAQINQQLGGSSKVKSENGNIYYVSGGQEYLVGGNGYNSMNFYNGLAKGGAGSTVMKEMRQAQKQIDDYVAQLADYRANLQSSAEDAAREAYVNQQLAQKTLRNNLSRYGLEKSGYYQKSQQNLKSDYEKALADIRAQLDTNLDEINTQESSIRKNGADAMAEILANNGLLTTDTINFATKEFPSIKISDVPVNQGLYAGKTAAEQKKKNEVSAEEFAAALNGNELNEYSKLANYVFKSDNLKEQLSKVKDLLTAGMDRNILSVIMQKLMADNR